MASSWTVEQGGDCAGVHSYGGVRGAAVAVCDLSVARLGPGFNPGRLWRPWRGGLGVFFRAGNGETRTERRGMCSCEVEWREEVV